MVINVLNGVLGDDNEDGDDDIDENKTFVGLNRPQVLQFYLETVFHLTSFEEYLNRRLKHSISLSGLSFNSVSPPNLCALLYL